LGLEHTAIENVWWDGDVLVIDVRLMARQRDRCGRCRRRCARYDAGRGRRRWRTLDHATTLTFLEADAPRVRCRDHGVVVAHVPWAAHGAGHTHTFDAQVAWLATRTSKSAATQLMRIAWRTVGAIIARVWDAAEAASATDGGLVRIGIDEISYKRGHQYLTVIANHDTGRVLHVAEGRNQAALASFFTMLGPERCQRVKAISMDMATIWRAPCQASIPQAALCFDPFHVIRWANLALDAVYKTNGRGTGDKQWRRTRYAIRAGIERLEPEHHQLIAELRRNRYALWRAWDLKERLRALYRNVEPAHARHYLIAWCRSAERSRLKPFINLARQIRKHLDGILAAVHHGLSNSRLEGINAKIRLINKRGFGHPNREHLTAMIHLCLGGITIPLPTQR